jgi:hypothetical protein
VRTPAAKVLSMILPEPSTAHDPAKADASALVDAATAVATDDINLTSTGSISQFLKGLEQLDDGDEDSPAAMRRITSYTTQHNACADAGSVDGSSSDTDSGSFSNDNSSSMLVSPPPTHAQRQRRRQQQQQQQRWRRRRRLRRPLSDGLSRRMLRRRARGCVQGRGGGEPQGLGGVGGRGDPHGRAYDRHAMASDRR